VSWVVICTVDAGALLVLHGVCCAVNLPTKPASEQRQRQEQAPAGTPPYAVPSMPAWAVESPTVESAAAIYSRALPEIRQAGTGRHRKAAPYEEGC